ncbi:hypothetical protein E2C01_040890 [Portunus trituberculatus]|uniref:Uncharacterized protein n=1 Tax=Portunus trituberculatus TaxID=210409 RepID=A0A5B7FS05_PORTR|nr:hypothetical protein [Portunus trituberculatus]
MQTLPPSIMAVATEKEPTHLNYEMTMKDSGTYHGTYHNKDAAQPRTACFSRKGQRDADNDNAMAKLGV